jgi:peptide/nickel transport system permease protein
MRFLAFLGSRILTYLLVIWIGITAVFFIPRFVPSDPVAAMLGRITAQASFMQPDQITSMRNSLAESFGLQGTLWEQYTHFLKRVLISGDFGPSLAMFPTPVTDLVRQYLPWSLALLLTSTIIAWVLGNLIGLLAGFWKDKTFSKVLEGAAIAVYPIPYYILALTLIILFAYLVPIFPFSFTQSGKQFSFVWFQSVIFSSLLPALSIVLGGMGWWVISMKALSSSIAEEDFVQFARLKGVSDWNIMRSYVARNAMLPQITVLALQLGGIFNGALITEILFGYPGVGTLMYQAVLQSDYNLMLGTISLSIVAVATATLVIDLAYPLLDPRIRHR